LFAASFTGAAAINWSATQRIGTIMISLEDFIVKKFSYAGVLISIKGIWLIGF
jgi:hypothetical protein